MDDNMKVAYVLSQITCAQVALASMIAANNHKMREGAAQAYNEQDFERIKDRFMIGHNAVIGYFTEG